MKSYRIGQYGVGGMDTNEWGANDKWLPGGVLPEGNLEAIIKTEGLKEGVHYTVKYLKK